MLHMGRYLVYVAGISFWIQYTSYIFFCQSACLHEKLLLPLGWGVTAAETTGWGKCSLTLQEPGCLVIAFSVLMLHDSFPQLKKDNISKLWINSDLLLCRDSYMGNTSV